MSKILTNPDGSLRLELRDDRLSAWLTILDGRALIDEAEILELINRAEIKNGFEEAQRYIRKHGLEREYGIPFPIAVCEYVKGETQLNYYFDLEQARGFDGRVSLRDLNTLTCLEAGSVIADHAGNIFDRQGSIYDIYGEMITGADTDPAAARQHCGDNVEFDESRGVYVAAVNGFPSVDTDGRISMLESVYFEGDLDGRNGTLRSTVNLEIRGGVASAEIVAAGNLRITGDLSSSRVYCEGNLKIGGQIRDCFQPGLDVKGDLTCAGIAGSTVLCRGKLNFTDKIQASEVVADKGVHSEAGSLWGGHLESSGDIEIANLGAADGTPTLVEITISPYNKALLTRLTKELIQLKQDPAANAARIKETADRIGLCEAAVDMGLDDFLLRPASARLKLLVSREVYPPVRIRILKHEYELNNRQSNLELHEKD